MAEMSEKFDDLMRVQGYTVFSGYKDYLVQKAKTHAQKEFDAWQERTRGIPLDQLRIA